LGVVALWVELMLLDAFSWFPFHFKLVDDLLVSPLAENLAVGGDL